MAVLWSGTWNFIGVLLSSGGVAYTIITLLPVELNPAGRLRRWFRHGFRPADCGHPLEPCHLDARPASLQFAYHDRLDHRCRLANQYLSKAATHTSGVDWSQVTNVFKVLLISPDRGICLLGLLLLLMKFSSRIRPSMKRQGHRASAILDPLHADPHLYRASASAMVRMTDRRVWASSCSSSSALSRPLMP